jgi:hypothetical protein
LPSGRDVFFTATSRPTLRPLKTPLARTSLGSLSVASKTCITKNQQTASGVATGTAKSRYIHPDHLGSTNVVTDENDNVVQTLDYYPYGATRISVATSTNEKRKYIDQFSDDSGLSYLNAR